MLRQPQSAVEERNGGASNPEVGRQGETTAKSLLECGGTIKIGDIGFSSVFGAGLQRCDSVNQSDVMVSGCNNKKPLSCRLQKGCHGGITPFIAQNKGYNLLDLLWACPIIHLINQ